MGGKDTDIGAKRARETRDALGLDARTPLACSLDTVESGFGISVVIAEFNQMLPNRLREVFSPEGVRAHPLLRRAGWGNTVATPAGLKGSPSVC